MQSSLSWLRQLNDPGLTDEFRMVAYDLRGHGASDKPLGHESYAEGRLWAEAAAVIAAAHLRCPVLVGWSYSGRVISDYLRFHGAGSIAGINFVDAVTKSGPEFAGPDYKLIVPTFSGDVGATRAFLGACFLKKPSQDDFERMLAFNMACPDQVRAHLMSRAPNSGDMLERLTVPALATHGPGDRIILPAMSEFTASAAPNAKLSLYEGVGHAPFFENAPRFNRELAAFVRAANAG